jgi:predicted ArsR family transcriptional regulator
VGTSERRLDLLKTLGDNTRYAIYLELARSPRPLATAEIADTLGLHPNTVRPHLERMRDVGLLDAHPDGRGAVGRPQNLYTLAADAPSLGLEPPVFPMLARMLLDLAADAGLDDDVVVAAGRAQGRRLAHSAARSDIAASPRRPCVDAAVAMLDELGFDPASVVEDQITTVAFGHCPFADLAESNPELVCALHRGLLVGFVDEAGGAHVEDFHDLSHREPCRATLVAD